MGELEKYKHNKLKDLDPFSKKNNKISGKTDTKTASKKVLTYALVAVLLAGGGLVAYKAYKGT